LTSNAGDKRVVCDAVDRGIAHDELALRMSGVDRHGVPSGAAAEIFTPMYLSGSLIALPRISISWKDG
jgi:hypothetical protein